MGQSRLIETNDGIKIWLEVSYVSARDENLYKELQNLPAWVRQQLQKFGCPWGRQAYIRLDPLRPAEPISAPRQNEWSQMLRDQSWKAFVDLATAQGQASWQWPKGNLVIRAAHSATPYSIWPLPGIPKHPSDHPIYRKIKEKARQARRWADAGCTYFPLFLILGTEDQGGRIDPDRLNGVPAEQAIYAALADTRQWDPITVYNRIGPGHGGRLRVPDSGLIAGVVFAKLENQFGGILYKPNRVWRGNLYMNPHPQAPLSSQYEDLICRINLNRVEYSPGWEEWQKNDRGDVVQRARRRRGRVVIKPKQDGSFEIEVPTVILTRILAGDVSAEAVWREYDSEILHWLQSALAAGQEITAAYIAEPDPTSREEPRLCLCFGLPQPTVIHRRKD